MKTRAGILLFFFLCCTAGYSGNPVDLPLTTWKFSEAGKNDWKNAEVPGNIHRDLLNNRLISDPTYRENDKKCQWVEKKEWEYTTSFTSDSAWFSAPRKTHAELVFESLDTYADVFLNDSLIGHADNMFRTWTINIDRHMHPGPNKLTIHFYPPVEYVHKHIRTTSYRYPADNDSTSPYTRKSPIQYGWDVAPRLVTCGIRKRVHLRTWNDFILRNVQVCQRELGKSYALMTATAEIESDINDSVWVALDPYKASKHLLLKKGINRCSLPFHIRNPSLWWPAGMGEPSMNELELEVFNDSSRSSLRSAFGLRTIEVVTKPDSLGAPFYLKVNGVPLYVKGANILPDPLLLRKSNQGYDLFAQALECNLNMLRIWGGGTYGDDDFYLGADQNGLLIWQDFMFAGTMYPGDSAFLASVEAEARDNIIRLRNHPSLALWCGNNEISVAWKNWGWQQQFHYTRADSLYMMRDYKALFDGLLPSTIARLDSSRFYFPSSPVSNWGKKEDLNTGDNHYWGIWHGEQPFEAFNIHVARFVSEFGFQSFPEMSSLRKFSTEGDWEIHSPVMKAHQFSYKGNALIQKYMELYYRKPKDFESFVYLTQVLQSDALKTGIEAQRRNKPVCMGSVFWQFNDYWPSASWSVLDYYGGEKAGVFQARKSFQAILLSPMAENGKLLVYAVNDETRARKTELCLLLTDLNGEHPRELRKDVSLKPGSSEKIYTALLQQDAHAKPGHPPALLEGFQLNDCVLSMALVSGKDTLAENLLYFVPPKDLALTQPSITYELRHDDDHYVMKLHGKTLAKQVYISGGDKEGIYPSDNFFDLVPGKTKTLWIYSDLSAEKLRKMIVIRSLWDTYGETGK